MASESGSHIRYLGRLVTHRNGEMTLFLPFVFVDDPDSDEMIRVVLVDSSDRSFAVLHEASNLEAALLGGDLQISKAGLPPASKASVEAMPEVEIGEQDSVTHCAICLDGMKAAKVMPCKHMFHGGCVEKWLKIHGSCPVCRFQMPSEEERGSRKGLADHEGGDDNNGTRRGGTVIWIPFPVAAVDQSSNQETEQQLQQQQTEDHQSSD